MDLARPDRDLPPGWDAEAVEVASALAQMSVREQIPAGAGPGAGISDTGAVLITWLAHGDVDGLPNHWPPVPVLRFVVYLAGQACDPAAPPAWRAWRGQRAAAPLLDGYGILDRAGTVSRVRAEVCEADRETIATVIANLLEPALGNPRRWEQRMLECAHADQFWARPGRPGT